MQRLVNVASPPTHRKYLGSLGLSRLRLNQGMSLEQIAEKTKISIRFLRAIEAEEFEKLPGGLFSTSYIRQYAAAIGFDENQLLGQFSEKMAPVQEEPVEKRRKSPGSETRTWLGRWLGSAVEVP